MLYEVITGDRAAAAIAAACASCHGTNGHSLGVIPSLAGQNRAYLLQALREFRAGTRPATIMDQIARGYSDTQLVTLSEYFPANPQCDEADENDIDPAGMKKRYFDRTRSYRSRTFPAK